MTPKALRAKRFRQSLHDRIMTAKQISVKRSVVSLIIGSGLALLPFLFETFPVLWPSPPLDEAVQMALGFLSLPGLIVGAALAGGNVHTYSLSVVVAVNLLFYTLIAYTALRWRHNRHRRLD